MTTPPARNDLAPTLGRLRSLARSFREDRMPNRSLLVLRAVAGDVDWPTDLDDAGVDGLRRCVDTLTRRVLLIADTGPGSADGRFVSLVAQWAVQATREARSALRLAGVPMTPGTGEMLHEAVTAALIWRKAQAGALAGVIGQTLEAQVAAGLTGAARWNGLARAGINGWAPTADVTALLDPDAGALPAGSRLVAFPDGEHDENPRYEIERRRPIDDLSDQARIDRLTIRVDDTAGVRVALIRTAVTGEVVGRIAFGLLELCLLMTSQHTVTLGLGEHGYGDAVKAR